LQWKAVLVVGQVDSVVYLADRERLYDRLMVDQAAGLKDAKVEMLMMVMLGD
jgi:hypothetical protein